MSRSESLEKAIQEIVQEAIEKYKHEQRPAEFLQSHKIIALERKVEELERQLAKYTKVQPKVPKKTREDNLILPPVTQSLNLSTEQPRKSSLSSNPRYSSKKLIKKEGLNAYDERFCHNCVGRRNYYERKIGTSGFNFGYHCAECDNPVKY
ncbi:Oidioi.mRNA.OKI2018_I69.PAR.g11575.t1.cds [Oikopleura dioica]|uniref:Oidioi.mRNA.OKI2018_I69.PAR.g11575.t1.cds n=1 Tax=Oikopleura dioica TaxID=34765 RepID=A0ABN7RWA6_OIKDI|nr:Oidioi.mRNA.OKI2018_I69.PAR.g11575.t1.cds [Oikopleura dioica]